MNPVFVIMEKEVRQIVSSRQTMISTILFVIIFAMASAPVTLVGEGNPVFLLDQVCFYLVLVLGIFTSYIFTGQVFLKEKQDGIVETLLCTPLSVREIWLGKVLGVTVPATILAYGAAALITAVAATLIDSPLFPSPPVLFHIIVVVPAFISAVSGLIGFAHLLLGMRDIQILNIGIIFGIIFLLTLTRSLLGPGFDVTWAVVWGSLLVAVLLLAIPFQFNRYINRERIVTTLPE
ncbi:MAG: hypothetical protein NT074_02595 [Methanomicrobiales archaeon]|jgi:ABC-2 type transport system permease protein|nr:hypothetical protein [Methanomicrobiales archaeon]